ncbi:MAG: hypothetical protein KY469_16240 [Actinobacteria bacterium]|nr:hypothetical protein [Actinomycetota bacterium]
MRRTIGTCALMAVLAVACGGDDAAPEPTARPSLTAVPVDPPSPPATPSTPLPAPSPSPSPLEEVSPTPHDPTDTDRARFIQGHHPDGAGDLEHVAIDVDGDAVEEIVFVYVQTAASVSRVEVAWWAGAEYRIEWTGDGGAADRVDNLSVRDVNADGRTEIAVSQSVGASGQSLTLWRAADGARRFDPLTAQGGCHAGSHTYGVVGAQLEDTDGDGSAEVHATCDDSPLPVAAWTTDVYVWRDDAYRFDRTRFPGDSP